MFFSFLFLIILGNIRAEISSDYRSMDHNPLILYDNLTEESLKPLVEQYRDKTPYMVIEFQLLDKKLRTIKLQFDLFWDVTPKTALNFVVLLTRKEKPCYLDSIFHRLISNFMIQGGDITAHNGTGGLSIYGKNGFYDENFEKKHEIGSLSMANRGPNTNSSQFFITFIQTYWLDGHHVVFGRLKEHCIKEFQVLQKVETYSSSNYPLFSVKIIECGLEEESKTDVL